MAASGVGASRCACTCKLAVTPRQSSPDDLVGRLPNPRDHRAGRCRANCLHAPPEFTYVSDDTRTRGVDLGPLAADLESESYPMDASEVVETYGDRTVDMAEGETTVRDLLEPQGEQTFDSSEAVTESLLTMVSSEALDREGYTDRGVGTEGETEHESL